MHNLCPFILRSLNILGQGVNAKCAFDSNCYYSTLKREVLCLFPKLYKNNNTDDEWIRSPGFGAASLPVHAVGHKEIEDESGRMSDALDDAEHHGGGGAAEGGNLDGCNGTHTVFLCQVLLRDT